MNSERETNFEAGSQSKPVAVAASLGSNSSYMDSERSSLENPNESLLDKGSKTNSQVGAWLSKKPNIENGTTKHSSNDLTKKSFGLPESSRQNSVLDGDFDDVYDDDLPET